MKAPEPQTMNTLEVVFTVLRILGPSVAAIYFLRLLGVDKFVLLLAGIGLYFVAISTGIVSVNFGTM